MHRKHRPAIEWDMLDRSLFDRIVEALVERQYGPDWNVHPIDGRGGDEGIDIDCTHKTSGERHVFQLKFFPEGFSGKHRARREQIKRSFTALNPLPDKWILVAPCASDQSGYTFLTGLVGDTKYDFWHRARLDELLADHSDLVDYFRRRDYGLEQVQQLGREQAALAGGLPDLTDRVVGLGATADTLSPNWAVDFYRQGEQVTHVLRAKHSRAAEVEPITATLVFDPEALPDEARRHMNEMDHGLAGRVEFPAAAIHQFAIDGPELLGQHATEDLRSVVLTTSPNETVVGKPLEMRLGQPNGPASVSYHGTTLDAGALAAGLGFRVRFHEIVTMTFLMPPGSAVNDDSPSGADCRVGSCTINTSYPPNASVETVKMATQLILDLLDAETIELCTTNRPMVLMGGIGPVHAKSFDRDRLTDLRDFADDISVIQKEARNVFPMPAVTTGFDRLQARALRLTIEHGHTYAPGVHGLTTTMSPDALNDPTCSPLLDGTPRILVLRQDPFHTTIFGHELTLPEIAFYHPAMRLRDPERVTAELKRGVEVNAEFESVDGSNMTMIMLSKYAPDGAPPHPWGLRGIPEPKPFPRTGNLG